MDMAEIPNFGEYRSISGASEERNTSCLDLYSILELGKGIRRGVRWGNPSSVKNIRQLRYCKRRARYSRGKHIEGGILVESTDNGVKEIDDILVQAITWSIAGNIESRCASGMLGELVFMSIRA